MIDIKGEKFRVIDAHAHIWNKFGGKRFGTTPIEPLGFGMVKQGAEFYRMLPPEYHDHQVPVEILLGYMDTVGIEKATILQNPCYGDNRDYVRQVCTKYPGKFVSVGMLDPRNRDDVVHQMDILFNEYKCVGFKLEVPDVPFKMDAPEYEFLWKKINDMGALVVLDLGWGDGPYDFNIKAFTSVMLKFPKMRTVLCHLGVSRLWDYSQPTPYPFLQKTLDLLDINQDNLFFDVSALQTCEPSLEYPFARCLDIFRTTVERCGIDRLMWGSDEPMILRHCTYKQTLTCFTKYADFLTAAEWEKFLFGNAEKVYFQGN